ncbi:FMN-binding protein [Anaerocolumna sp.]|uniref:FMN-binding protein n=1 Tax=Anaerocolumna sp. TaxID=2041569 RepID=UPI0028A80F61|nr:FMN-binding protein [Anaerocolumna sp.]
MKSLKRTNNRKRYLLFLIPIAIIILIAALSVKFNEIIKQANSIAINPVDFTNIQDGTYQGEYYIQDFIGAKVKVTIENGEIINITLLDHKYGLGKKAEEIIDIVKEKQTLEVDTISGATYSSTMIIKAIENALRK